MRHGGKSDFCREGTYTKAKSLGKGLYCLENGHKKVLDTLWHPSLAIRDTTFLWLDAKCQALFEI